jgi:hypothetical protein
MFARIAEGMASAPGTSTRPVATSGAAFSDCGFYYQAAATAALSRRKAAVTLTSEGGAPAAAAASEAASQAAELGVTAEVRGRPP